MKDEPRMNRESESECECDKLIDMSDRGMNKLWLNKPPRCCKSTRRRGISSGDAYYVSACHEDGQTSLRYLQALIHEVAFVYRMVVP